MKKDWKLQRQIEKLRAKNKQLQDLFLNKSKKKHKQYTLDTHSSEESEPEPTSYSRTPANPPIYFC